MNLSARSAEDEAPSYVPIWLFPQEWVLYKVKANRQTQGVVNRSTEHLMTPLNVLAVVIMLTTPLNL